MLKISQLVLRVETRSLLDPTLEINPKLYFQKVLPCEYPRHTWILGLMTLHEVVSSNFHALNN
jgi:hypothetical protein